MGSSVEAGSAPANGGGFYTPLRHASTHFDGKKYI
jgi:hypothetical protein